MTKKTRNEGIVMSANQKRFRGGRDGSCHQPESGTQRDVCGEIHDAEQVRRDLFSEAVRQVLARQAMALKEKQKREFNDVECRGILTGSELQFLLKQD